MALTSTTVNASIVSQFAIGSATANLNVSASESFGSGTTTTNADIKYIRQHSITNGVALSLDLSGSLTQPDGSSAVFVEVVAILVKHVSGTGVLTIGGGSNPLTGVTGTAGPNGGFFALANDTGIAVTAGTGDLLQVTSSSGTIVADIVIIGRTA
jgi:hypothetical protein